MKILYQLRAKGPMYSFNRSEVIRSKKVYTTQELAERDKESFIAKCCGDGIFDLSSVDECTIVTLDLVEE